jgi:16S rRNA (guanine527-N7)-methyltransferase
VNASDFRVALLRRADLAGVSLPPEQVDALYRYFDLLRRWNKTVNLTALPLDGPTDQTFDRLIVEPLTLASVLDTPSGRWFDLGSGGGSPAIPLRITFQSAQLTMVEARNRKASFLREAVRVLDLATTDVRCERFEILQQEPSLAHSAGLVTVRAVKIDAELLALSVFLLRIDGFLVLMGHGGTAPQGFKSVGHPWVYRRDVPRETLPSS